MGRRRERGAVVNITNTTKRVDNIIGSNSVVKGDVLIGEDVVVGSMVLIEGVNVKIGDRTRIMPFAAIGSNTEIGKDCFIGPFFAHANAVNPVPNAQLLELKIGDETIIGARVTIEPGITIGKKVFVAMGAYIDADVPDEFFVPRLGAPRPRNDL